ncbi:hypothetical protein KCP74_21510 [Salmonella enterica subsp. enterica]|nr:hypothetical protein KCP74_21510 [Salmonella enterica subsp. enterica]
MSPATVKLPTGVTDKNLHAQAFHSATRPASHHLAGRDYADAHCRA